jgi:DNA-binding transcriptional LysR family regulator
MAVLLCEFQQRNPGLHVALRVHDTQRIIELVADRALELGVVGAAPRHRGVQFEPFFRDEVILVCPPDHRFADRTVTLDELRAEPLIAMQEGAGVRQVLEDELRAQGLRLRDLDVRVELGLQESVKTAVQRGYGLTFISSTSVEAELAAGTLAAAHVEGFAPVREISLVRSTGRPPSRAAQAFLDFAKDNVP